MSDCAKFIDYRGKTPPKRDKGIRLITAKNVKMGFIQRHPEEYIDPTVYDDWMTRGFPQVGDVLFTTEAPLGNVAQLDTDETVVIGQRLITLQPDRERIDPAFLKYALTSPGVQAELHSRATGATVQGIKAKLLKQIPIPLPPLEEQQRIVAVLDEAFEGLACARVHAEANLQNARELFDEAEARLFGEISAGSTKTTLGQLASFRNGLNYSRSSQGEEVKVVGVGDFKDNFDVPTESLSYSKIDGQLGQDDRLVAGDILAVRSNGNRDLIGRTMLMSATEESISFSGFSIRIRLTSADVLPEYVCSYLRTKAAKALLTAGGAGANISNLNQRILSSFPISFPNTDGQRGALEHLKLLRAKSHVLRDTYARKLQDIDDLRQSLLQRAFAGELTE